MEISKTAVAIGLLTALPVAVGAQELSYTYLELDYVNVDLDALDQGDVIEELDDGDGWALRGSLSLTDNFFLFGAYSDQELDATTAFQGVVVPADFDLEILEVGGGYHTPLNDDWDFVGRLGYTDFDLGNFRLGATEEDDFEIDDIDDDSSDGFLIDAGLRGQIAPTWEAGAGLRYRDIEDDDEFSAFGNILWEFAPQWGLNLSADLGSDIRFINAGVRWSF